MSSDVELVGDGRRIGPERADVALDERSQVIGDVRDRQQGQPGQFVGEHPQAHLVEFDLPRLGERVDRGGNEHQRRSGARDRQVVDAERPPGEVADHRADAHPEHRRRHHLAQPGHHLGHAGRRRRPSGRSSDGPSDVARSVNSGRYASSVCCAHCSGVATERFGRRHLELHHVGDVQPGDAGEFAVLDAHRRVDVARRRRAGSGQQTATVGARAGRTVWRHPSSAGPVRTVHGRDRRTAAARRRGRWIRQDRRRRPWANATARGAGDRRGARSSMVIVRSMDPPRCHRLRHRAVDRRRWPARTIGSPNPAQRRPARAGRRIRRCRRRQRPSGLGRRRPREQRLRPAGGST